MRTGLRWWLDALLWVLRCHRLSDRDVPIGYSLAEVVAMNEAHAAHEAAERDTWATS